MTDLYAIENYLACEPVVRRFFLDFVKLKKVDFDLDRILPQFDRQLKAFYRAVLPVMAWVVVVRRTGRRPVLTDVNLGDFLTWSESGVARRKGARILRSLGRVTKIEPRHGEWKQVRQTCRELRRLEPKRYVRGKFEAWFLLGFTRQLLEELSAMARESGGSISVSAQLSDSNFVQLLVRAVPIPQPLASFLEFHFKHGGDTAAIGTQPGARSRVWGRVRSWFRRGTRG